MGLQAVSGLLEYQQAKRADSVAKKTAYAEANILEADSRVAAREELLMADKAKHSQAMAYLKSGVDLAGSPLLVMEETRNKGIENMQNTLDSAKRKASLIRMQGSVKRASLVNTALSTGVGMNNTYLNSQLLKQQTQLAPKA